MGLIVVLVLAAVVVTAPAFAYVDPGTASAVWAFGLAPVVGFLGWIGRQVVRKLLRRGGEDEEDEGEEEGAGERGRKEEGS